MRLNLTITTALVTLLTGLVVWALQPTQKVFSWVETLDLEYLVGLTPRQQSTPISIRTEPAISFLQYQEALESLKEGVAGAFYPYVSMGSMGKRLILENGESFPIFYESYVSEGYFEARQVSAQYGRLLREDDENVIVLGHRLARQIFGDPGRAVGQGVELMGGTGSQRLTIVGVMSPSPAQNPKIDVDEGLVGNLQSAIDEWEWAFEIQPLFIQISFHDVSDVSSILPQLELWAQAYFGPQGEVVATDELLSETERAFITETLPKITARRATLLAFGIALTTSALLALYAQSYWHLLRRRQLLGVEKALGATQKTLVLRLLTTQLPWGILGSLLGWLGLWSLYDMLPQVFLTRPPAVVLLVSMLTPILALLILAGVTALPIIKQSAMSLLRGKVAGRRVRPLLFLVYGGLALAVAGGLAASQVYQQVKREATALQVQFGHMYTVQTGATYVDTRAERAFEEARTFEPIFSEEDARAVEGLEGVSQATLAQGIPELGIAYKDLQTRLSAVAADSAYLGFIGLRLLQGTTGGCILEAQTARDLGIGVGEAVQLLGLRGLVPCQVSGIFETPPALWRWLVRDLPEIVTPPLGGLGLQFPNYTAEPFRSIRILLKLESPEVEETVKAWQEAEFPNPSERAEVIPYTPDVQDLLSSLRIQAQIFLLIAVLAAALSIWGIVGGFLALLDAERFRIAVDRALGLSLARMTRVWWWQTLSLSILSAALGLLIGAVSSTRLYNALALDIPNLPERASLALGPLPLLVVVFVLLVLSSSLTWLAYCWLKRQSSLTLLKEGAA